MGCTSNIDGFVGKIVRAAGEIQNGSRAGVTAAALVYTTAIRAEMVRAGVKNGRLRGVGPRGAAIGVGFNVVGVVTPTALVRARGPFHLIEGDTRAHRIDARRKQAMSTAYGPKSSVVSKGTKGRHPFERGVVAATPAAEAELAKSVVASVAAVFR